MLKTRIVTALILIAVLAGVLWTDSFYVFTVLMLVFFAGGAWELARLFDRDLPIAYAAVATVLFSALVFIFPVVALERLNVLAALGWIYLIPVLFRGLPEPGSTRDVWLEGIYMIALMGSFAAVLLFYARSPLTLVSVMAIAWLADIGAYFSGRTFGKRKLAPSISPGKTWEGVVGGWLAVIVCALGSVYLGHIPHIFSVILYEKYGVFGMIGILSLLTAVSVIGDLLESSLKRRRGFKDSSQLLPGHGGILDRIDSLIPLLPAAALWVM